jgi:hypothetical protein
MSSTGANYTTAQVKARGDLKVYCSRMLTYAYVCSRMLAGQSLSLFSPSDKKFGIALTTN